MLGNLLSGGAADLVKGVGGVIDDLHTSEEERQVINHEMKHATEIKLGKLYYDDDKIIYNGETFERKTINGKDMINVRGEWKEAGHTGFPWEDDANTM